jgi:hypothetical protein
MKLLNITKEKMISITSASSVFVCILISSQSLSKGFTQETLLEKLDRKHNITDPYNNRGDEKVYDKLRDADGNQPIVNRELEYELVKRNIEKKLIYKSLDGTCDTPNGYVLNARNYCEKDAPIETPLAALDFSSYGDLAGELPAKLLQHSTEIKSITDEIGVPTQSSGKFDISISTDKVKLERDVDGNLISVINATTTYQDNSLSRSGLVSSEADHSDSLFEANNSYGDNDDLILKGRASISHEKTSPTSAGLAYQTILDSQITNPVPDIHPRDPILDAGFAEVLKAENGEGQWAAQCNTEDVTTTTSVHYPIWENHFCTEPKRDNDQSCQVEREAIMPISFERIRGTNPSITNMTFVDEYTLRISLTSENNTITDARGYNDDYPSQNPFGKHDCAVYWSEYKVIIKDGFTIASATRTSGLVDDIAREFVNGQITGRMRERPYFNNAEWAAVGDDLPFPLWYYNGFPMDAKLSFDYGQRTNNFQECEHENGSGVGANLTSYFQNPPDNTITLQLLHGIGGSGEINLTYDIRFDQRISPRIDYTQVPEGCAENIGWSIDASQTCGATCDPQTELEKGFCKADVWQVATSGSLGFDQSILNLIPPMFIGDTGNVTWKMNAQGYMCDPLGGNPLPVDLNGDGVIDPGEEATYEDIRMQPNKCAAFENDPLCSEQSSECEEGWNDEENNTCYMFRKEFSCDIGPVIETETTITSESCSSALPCIMGECEIGVEENNSDFIEAMVQLNLAQHMEGDYTCTNPADPSTCTIFNGEGSFCTWEQTGMGNDCCEAPGGTSVLEYAMMANDMMNHTQNMDLQMPDAISGGAEYAEAGYEMLSESVTEYWDEATQSFIESPVGEAAAGAYDYVVTSITDIGSTFAGNASEELLVQGAEGAAEAGVVSLNDAVTDEGATAMLDEMKQEMANKIANALPDELRDQLFTAVGDETAEGATDYVVDEALTEAAGNIYGAVMGAYMAYTYIKLALSLYSGCHEIDMTTAVKVSQRQCISIDNPYHPEWDFLNDIQRQDYCCYSSILARIIMEQASPLIGHDLTALSGTIEDDTDLRLCQGLTADELSGLDWSQIDLQEWIDIMMASGIAPSETSEESLTGDGRKINENGRDTGVNRNLERVESSGEGTWATRAIEARQALKPENIDCSYLPRPVVCQYNTGP